MNSDEFGQVLRREREPGAVVKVRYCRSDPRWNSTPSTLLFTAKPNFGQKNVGSLEYVDYWPFVEKPHLNTTTLVSIMQSCSSVKILSQSCMLLTEFKSESLFENWFSKLTNYCQLIMVL